MLRLLDDWMRRLGEALSRGQRYIRQSLLLEPFPIHIREQTVPVITQDSIIEPMFEVTSANIAPVAYRYQDSRDSVNGVHQVHGYTSLHVSQDTRITSFSSHSSGTGNVATATGTVDGYTVGNTDHTVSSNAPIHHLGPIPLMTNNISRPDRQVACHTNGCSGATEQSGNAIRGNRTHSMRHLEITATSHGPIIQDTTSIASTAENHETRGISQITLQASDSVIQQLQERARVHREREAALNHRGSSVGGGLVVALPTRHTQSRESPLRVAAPLILNNPVQRDNDLEPTINQATSPQQYHIINENQRTSSTTIMSNCNNNTGINITGSPLRHTEITRVDEVPMIAPPPYETAIRDPSQQTRGPEQDIASRYTHASEGSYLSESASQVINENYGTSLTNIVTNHNNTVTSIPGLDISGIDTSVGGRNNVHNFSIINRNRGNARTTIVSNSHNVTSIVFRP